MPDDLSDADLGRTHALRIQRNFPPAKWVVQIDNVPIGPQAICREYLRGMYQRIQHIKRLAANKR